jgi:hypothetical protein
VKLVHCLLAGISAVVLFLPVTCKRCGCWLTLSLMLSLSADWLVYWLLLCVLSAGDVRALRLLADAVADASIERLQEVQWDAKDRWGDTPLQVRVVWRTHCFPDALKGSPTQVRRPVT